MKRKLNERDVPEVASTPLTKEPETAFDSFGLEPRLLRGIRDQRWSSPTLVQAKAIPLALEGKDILARSGTGTGKTAAYLLPILHKTVRRKEREISTLILVPTKELALQVTKLTQSLSAHCGQDVRVQNIAGKESDVVQRAKLADLPDIVVATPARVSVNLNNGALSLKSLAHLVVDEGDLVMGYGFEEDLDNISKSMPKGVQIFLMSATLNTDLDTLKGIFCRDPVILQLDDLEKDAQLVKQYVIRCAEDEKFLLIYAMFLLKLIKGKTIIFVGDLDRSYRVKLFLEQFGIRSCVLNSELPLTSRLHIVEEFNKNIYDILIASDENEVLGTEGKKKSRRDKQTEEAEEPTEEQAKEQAEQPPESSQSRKKAKLDDTNGVANGETAPTTKSRTKSKPTSKNDSGVSRGIDFLNVSCVLNFDMPSTYKSYFHRIGRTARAGKSGTAISFIIPKDKYRRHKPTTFAGCENDEEVLQKVEKHQKEGQKVEDYAFDMKRLEPFRYRFADALRAVTRIAIREARIKELRSELLKSQKLSRYFEENPTALSHLRHDQNLNHPARIQAHLKHVPDYLLPGGSKKALADDIGFVGPNKDSENRFRRARAMNRAKGKGRKVVRNKSGKVDPLKTFNARGKGKK
ncbi:P-loop containing nucleoside triphosphate hydrolase protein [Clohesyomyces aquaticus]|uniref:RNA helicase n=1 Tax=Clohesyomyces aquaticus TaxID=1231657 RepID=A0A1Y2A760_9PLEO|nr:P-loop containing nucleoside triphosphate hydrolase protein [Clohesyomyces aquaticus]